MNDLDRSIIATLAYYGAFYWPLTLMEICGRLIPAVRLGGRTVEPTAGTISERLDRLIAMEMVHHEHGLYALSNEAGFANKRIEQEKIWAQKWRRVLRHAWFLQVVPYVRSLSASGSLALGNMSLGSDWDFFTIAQAGRLYTTRTGLLAASWLMGSLRTKRDTTAANKFCFNHYVTTDSLSIKHRSLYVAHGLATMVPVFDTQNYLERLWQANWWMRDYLPRHQRADYVRRSVRPSRTLFVIRYILESVLNTPVGGWLERVLRAWQQRRIAHVPATYERGGRVIASDRELEFHPRSFEAVALARYNAVLAAHGMHAGSEKDSGLTR